MSRAPKQPVSSAVHDPFGPVLGTGRGIDGAPASQRELRAVRAALDEARVHIASAQARERDLLNQIEVLKARVKDLNSAKETAEKNLWHANRDKSNALIERDRARYAAMRTGIQDPYSGLDRPAFHQGAWTPGRPYLAYEHVWQPKTGECYCSSSTGAPAGEIPGTGRHWVRCLDPEGCPRPVAPRQDVGTALVGPMLRRAELVPSTGARLKLPRALTDDELTRMTNYLRANANDLCKQEWHRTTPLVPNPVHAYSSAAAWMADTPLMRALVRERRRRQQALRRASRRSVR